MDDTKTVGREAADGASTSGTARRPMTVAEAGRKGGITVRNERGHRFYEEIGRKGGQKVRELIQRGKSRT
jgi:uncharacterized protein